MIFKFSTDRNSMLAPPEGCAVFGVIYTDDTDEEMIAEVLLDLETGDLILDTFWGPVIEKELYIGAADRVIVSVLGDVFGKDWRNDLLTKSVVVAEHFADLPVSKDHSRNRLLKATRAMVLSGVEEQVLGQMLVLKDVQSKMEPGQIEQIETAAHYLWSSDKPAGCH